MNELILIIDDDPKIIKISRDYLESSGFRTVSATDGTTALAIARREKPDFIILDLNLPGTDGLDVCRQIRRESDIPIIMLTARIEEMDRLIGLELGADDYLTKPFSPRELVARVRSVLRRTQGHVHNTGIIQVGDLEIDVQGVRVTHRGQIVDLTRSEFSLLVVLAQHIGQAFSREQLVKRLYGDSYEGFSRSVDSHIKNLRQKIEDDPSHPRYVQTVYGIGYRLDAE